MRRRGSRGLAALLGVVLAAALTVGVPGDAVAAPVPPDPCATPRAAAQAVQDAIDAHNARPHVFEIPRQQADLDAYDQEAAKLNGDKGPALDRLKTCLSAMEELAASETSSAPFTTNLTPTARQQLDQARSQAQSWTATAPAAGQRWEVPKASPARPVYEFLRPRSPGRTVASRDAVLQGRPRPNVGDRDYALTNGTFAAQSGGSGPDVRIDHIVSLAEVVSMPGFMKLTPENMINVANAPLNLQWLSAAANASKSSRSVAAMTGVDPGWQSSQVLLENRVRSVLLRVIQELLKSQAP